MSTTTDPAASAPAMPPSQSSIAWRTALSSGSIVTTTAASEKSSGQAAATHSVVRGEARRASHLRVVDDKRMPGGSEVASHQPAHLPETDEAHENGAAASRDPDLVESLRRVAESLDRCRDPQ